MKTLFIAGFMMICGALSAQNIISSQEIKVTITGATTREELAQLAQSMKEQGIVFKYSPQFDGQRHLTGIKFRLFNAQNEELGNGENMHLNEANNKTSFRMVKEGDRYVAKCMGTCD